MTSRRVRAAVSLAAVIAFAGPVAAHAEPRDPAGSGVSREAVAKARRDVVRGESAVAAVQKRLDGARGELDKAHEAVAVSSEKVNAARETLRVRTQDAVEARKKADRAAGAEVASQRAVEQMAADLYMRGGPAADLAWLYAGSTGDLARNRVDLQAAEGFRTAHLLDAKKAHSEAVSTRVAASKAQQEQQKAAVAAASALGEAQQTVAEAQRRQTALETEERQLVAELATLRRTSVAVEQRRQEQLQREAAQREAAQARARVARQASADAAAPAAAVAAGTSAPDAASIPPAGSGSAATAIAWAQAQLGKPYQWGGNGPGSFDCSGLMVGAWRAAGSSLPRTAQWQYGATKRVAIADLQPGDLVFFGHSTSSIYHVAMYVGDGKMIEAPRTGLNIRYSSIYRSTLLPYGGRV